ncbi:MAG TPA: LysE family transporter [Chitinophagaceae bacterium]|nr:LysE family transporter [Chitinophagaceae bacterium]
MHPLVRILFTGMLVSFIGSLPLGTLNIAAMQISITDGVTAAMLFSVGSLIAEIIYVRISLVAMDWVRKQEKILKALDWVTFLIVAALAAFSFYAAMQPTVEKNIVLSSPLPKIVLGFVMSAVNPVQIPFWFGWSTVLFTKKVLLPRSDHYNSYIVGIGLGTFLGNCIFIFGGLLIAQKINNNQHVLNWIIGGIFALTALLQLWKILRKKDTMHKLEHPEEVTQHIEEQIDKLGIEPDEK